MGVKTVTDGELAVLAGTFLFRGLTKAEIDAALAGRGAEKRVYARGEVIYSPTGFRRELGILLSGSVTVTKGALTVSALTAGDLFGAAALYTDEGRYVSTLTARTACEVLFLSQESVDNLIDTSRLIRENYLRYLAQRIRFLSAKVDALSVGTGERKLSAYLLRHVDETGRLTVRSMTELASTLGIGRASLYRELAKLQAAGLIEHTGKTIRVLKPELLK